MVRDTHTHIHTRIHNINTDVHSTHTDTPLLPFNTHTNWVIHHYLKKLLLYKVSPHMHHTLQSQPTVCASGGDVCSCVFMCVCVNWMLQSVAHSHTSHRWLSFSYKEDVFEFVQKYNKTLLRLFFYKTLQTLRCDYAKTQVHSLLKSSDFYCWIYFEAEKIFIWSMWSAKT